MRFRLDVPAAATADLIRARLAPERWAEWWPGARSGHAGRVDLDLAGPRPLRVGLQVVPRPDGAEVALVEGELSACTVIVSVGERVVADVELVFPVAIPAALRHDLETWLTSRLALLAAPGPGSPEPRSAP